MYMIVHKSEDNKMTKRENGRLRQQNAIRNETNKFKEKERDSVKLTKKLDQYTTSCLMDKR